MTTLQVKPWQRVVEHEIFPPAYRVQGVTGAYVTPPVPFFSRCSTRLPALLCSCRRYFIETVEDGQGPRAVGYGGEIG